MAETNHLEIAHSIGNNIKSLIEKFESRWNLFMEITLIRGTVKLNGSIVLFVKRNAFANSTVETSQWFLVRKLNPWCDAAERWCDNG